MARAVTPAVCLYRVFSTWGAVRGEGGGAGRENKEAGVKEEMWRIPVQEEEEDQVQEEEQVS